MRRASGGGPREGQAGFSLVELLVAITVTAIISAAIYGLMFSGQASFRRDPELTERQQNIRVAMDVIQRDIASGGMGMNRFVQTFTNGLDSTGTVPSVINGVGQNDVLEILGNDGQCRPVEICEVDGTRETVYTFEPLPSCYSEGLPGFIYVSGSTSVASSLLSGGVLFASMDPPTFGTACAGRSNSHVNFAPANGAPFNPPNACGAPGGVVSETPQCNLIAKMQLVRYEIAPDPADVTIPCLWRSQIGRASTDGTATGIAPPGGGWQMVARGIDDLQVQYMNGAAPGIWSDAPGAVVDLDFNSIVQQVRVTLSARAFAIGLGGGAAPASGPATRGQLTSVTAPRSALNALGTNDVDGPGGPALPPWQ
jgi:prepilin-type N-terminal cleavage/methylation domain-containing protein